ncbi:DUF2935 domain-containing protein [Sporosarcina newyorkensis]
MLSKNYQEEALFELHFWLQILGDHARFIHDSLAPGEAERIQQADTFIRLFDQLLTESKRPMDNQALQSLLQTSKTESEQIRLFKLQLVAAQLAGEIKITLTPSFINHMVNEVEEAIRLFEYLAQGELPPLVHPLHHDLLWLLDAAGHAGAIDANLDRVEKSLKEKGQKFTQEWEAFYLKAVEMAGFLRTNVTQFPALAKFHQDINLEMTIFKSFLRELEEWEMNKDILGSLTPLMADHMAREECYYLIKLSETTDIAKPSCDPSKPRTI